MEQGDREDSDCLHRAARWCVEVQQSARRRGAEEDEKAAIQDKKWSEQQLPPAANFAGTSTQRHCTEHNRTMPWYKRTGSWESGQSVQYHSAVSGYPPHPLRPAMGALVVTLFYNYCEVADVPASVKTQRELLSSLSLRGRVRVAPEGINSTVCGTATAVSAYEAATAAAFAPGAPIDFKRSACGAQPFADARVRAVREVVTLGAPALSAAACAEHVTPAAFRERLLAAAERRRHGVGVDDLLVLDVRNGYESDIGHFEGAVLPGFRQFSDFPKWARENEGIFEGRDVYMFCTGGVRCEKASAFLIERVGVERSRVRQLEGGIVRFLDMFGDGDGDGGGGGGGVWRGKNLVFDARLTDQGSADVIGKCVACGTGCDDYSRDARCRHCRRRLLVCSLDDCGAPQLCKPCNVAYENGTLRRAGKLEQRLQAPVA